MCLFYSTSCECIGWNFYYSALSLVLFLNQRKWIYLLGDHSSNMTYRTSQLYLKIEPGRRPLQTEILLLVSTLTLLLVETREVISISPLLFYSLSSPSPLSLLFISALLPPPFPLSFALIPPARMTPPHIHNPVYTLAQVTDCYPYSLYQTGWPRLSPHAILPQFKDPIFPQLLRYIQIFIHVYIKCYLSNELHTW